MKDQIQSIPLPDGWKLETYGVEHVAGGFIHFIDPNGEIQTRLRGQDFADRPQEAAIEFLEAFGKILPNLATEPGHGYEVANEVFLCGDEDELWVSLQHPIEREVSFDEDLEVIYYAREEWTESPEEVIGALLMCLKAEIEIANAEESAAEETDD